MKNTLLILAILIAGLLACKKESEKKVVLPDVIVFTPADTNHQIYTFRYATPSPVPLGCPDIPTPSDSSAFLLLDLDHDTITDFIITAAHSQYTSGYCGHCSRFTYTVNIEGMHEDDSIRVVPNSLRAPIPESMDTSVNIAEGGIWSKNGLLELSGGCTLPFTTSFSDMYIGLKKGKSYGWLHIKPRSNNGIYMLESAINKTEGNPIKAGQHP